MANLNNIKRLSLVYILVHRTDLSHYRRVCTVAVSSCHLSFISGTRERVTFPSPELLALWEKGGRQADRKEGRHRQAGASILTSTVPGG